MATRDELLKRIGERQPVTVEDVAKDLDSSLAGTRKQMKRLKDGGLVEGDAEKGWSLTEAGATALEEGIPVTREDEGATPRQVFEAIGKRIGIPINLVELASNIVWEGGDYEDIIWVNEALKQGNIRADWRSIWVNSWRVHIKKPIPEELAAEFAGAGKGKEAEEEVTARTKADREHSYMLVDNVPVFVGRGLGDLNYNDAVDLARLRTARAVGAPSDTKGQQAWGPTEVLDFINKVKEFTGSEEKKSYVVTQTVEGAKVQEVVSGEPVVVGQAPQNPPSSFMVDQQGQVKELKPGEPVVVQQPAAQPTTYLVKPDGTLVEQKAGQPIVIQVPAPSQNPSVPVQITGPDGKPIVMDLTNVITWKKYEAEEKRAEESHKIKMDAGSAIKEFLTKIGAAATRLSGEK